jgi:hypothetical protein
VIELSLRPRVGLSGPAGTYFLWYALTAVHSLFTRPGSFAVPTLEIWAARPPDFRE